MGRKGVSKRKPSQTKSKPFSSGAASGSVSSLVQAPVSLPVKPIDTGKVLPSTRGGTKPPSDRKKNARKG